MEFSDNKFFINIKLTNKNYTISQYCWLQINISTNFSWFQFPDIQPWLHLSFLPLKCKVENNPWITLPEPVIYWKFSYEKLFIFPHSTLVLLFEARRLNKSHLMWTIISFYLPLQHHWSYTQFQRVLNRVFDNYATNKKLFFFGKT